MTTPPRREADARGFDQRHQNHKIAAPKMSDQSKVRSLDKTGDKSNHGGN